MKTREEKRVSPLNDLAFKKVFGSIGNEDILAGLIQDFFGYEPKKIEINNPYSIKAYKEAQKNGIIANVLRETRRDISAKFEVADFTTELQIQKNDWFDVRSVYYAFDGFCNNYNRAATDGLYGEDAGRYASLRPVYALNILGHKYFDDEDAYRLFDLYDAIRKKRFKTELLRIGYFEFGKTNLETPNHKYWSAYFMGKELPGDAPTYMKKASNIISYTNLQKEEREMIDYADLYEQDRKAEKATAKREGHREGHREGRREGRREGYQDVARNLKSEGIPIQTIVKATGLTEDVIKKL
jgi:predicted transposase/invertase (TIGR01784 family)